MEIDKMACKEGGVHIYDTINNEAVCRKCGHVSQCKPISIERLLKENEQLKKRIKGLEALLRKHRIDI